MRYLLGALIGLAVLASGADGALATGAPTPWGLGLQEPASPNAERINEFHNLLLIVITLITLFVMGLLGWVGWRYRASRNPTPAQFSHNTVVEVIWTAVPVLILVLIAIPSFRLLFYLDKVEDAEMTLKVVGNQWYWSYVYPDQQIERFDSFMIPDDEIDAAAGQMRLLEVDNRVVLPVDTNIRLLFTSDDVLHSWAVPSLGIKMDTVPGRTNETWVRVSREGVFRGQCSELCGVNHAFMPIVVEAVSKPRFEAWVSAMQDAQEQGAGYVQIADVPEPGGAPAGDGTDGTGGAGDGPVTETNLQVPATGAAPALIDG